MKKRLKTSHQTHINSKAIQFNPTFYCDKNNTILNNNYFIMDSQISNQSKDLDISRVMGVKKKLKLFPAQTFSAVEVEANRLQ